MNGEQNQSIEALADGLLKGCAPSEIRTIKGIISDCIARSRVYMTEIEFESVKELWYKLNKPSDS